jgi:NadR type nicotinamide-nucleotide adenylyltransferase
MDEGISAGRPMLTAPLLRVVTTGSESTGKTTLARDLAAHYATAWVPEHVRDYLDAKGAPLTAADVEEVARGQIAAEDRAAPRARGLLVLDTDLLSTVVYSHHYYGGCPEWVERVAAERAADLYLLLNPDVPWRPDPQRDRGDRREEMHALFREALEGRGLRYVDVTGWWPERKARAVEAMDALRLTSPGVPSVVRPPEIP